MRRRTRATINRFARYGCIYREIRYIQRGVFILKTTFRILVCIALCLLLPACGAAKAPKQTEITVLAAARPHAAPSDAPSGEDAFWSLPLPLPPAGQKLRNMLRRAARDIVIEQGGADSWTAEHAALVEDFCRAEGLPVWARIPFNRAVAEAYSRGEVAVRAVPELRAVLLALMARMQGAAAASTTASPAAVRHA